MIAPRTTHYDTLGVSSTATPDEIRDAFRRLAREHHPDRTAASGARDSTMAEINVAYRVLSDPARRSVYDAGLRGATVDSRPRASNSAPPAEPAPTMPTFPSHLGPARFPWRSMLFVGTLAVLGVVVLAQFTEPGEPRGPDGIMRVGSCVMIEANGDAREIACTDDPATDLVVRAFVAFDARCPTDTRPHRDRQGMGVACVEVPMAGSG